MAEGTEGGGKKSGAKRDVNMDLGFGGLFQGLSDFLDLLGSKMEQVEELQETMQRQGGGASGIPPRGGINRSGEFKVRGLGDKGRGVYGFSVRSMAEGMPKVERFGNIRRSEEGPVEVADVREPLVDVFDEDAEIMLVAELPGVNEDEITVELHDDVLSLETTGDAKFGREVLLPAPVVADSLQQTYRNGILEIRLTKDGGSAPGPDS